MPRTLFLVIVVACLLSCKKEASTPAHTGTTIALYNKPLDTIQSYTFGRWQLVASGGGISGKDNHTYSDEFIEFKPDSLLFSNSKGVVLKASSISWVRSLGLLGDSTYILTNWDQGIIWGIYGISNDTLTIYDNHPDGYTYALIRTGSEY
jgi:hypothetical protein